MTIGKDIQKFKEYVVGMSLLTTFNPVGVIHFKSWKQYKVYRDELKSVMADFNRKWAKIKAGEQGKMLIKLNDDMEKVGDRWARKLGLAKKKLGVKKLKEVL